MTTRSDEETQVRKNRTNFLPTRLQMYSIKYRAAANVQVASLRTKSRNKKRKTVQHQRSAKYQSENAEIGIIVIIGSFFLIDHETHTLENKIDTDYRSLSN